MGLDGGEALTAMNTLATLLIGIPVAALALIDIVLRLRSERQRRHANDRSNAETRWLRDECRKALDRNERRIVGEIGGRHAGRGTFESSMKEHDLDDARTWFARTGEMVDSADRETLRTILFALEPAPRLPATGADIWRDVTAHHMHDLVEAAKALAQDELTRRQR